MKKTLIVILSVLMLGCLSLAAACANKVKAEFKTNLPTEFFVGQEIDFEDFIVRVERADHTLTIDYKSGVEEKDVQEVLKGYQSVFYPKSAGVHKITYEVSKGGKTDISAMEITVKNYPPKINFASNSYAIRLNRQNDYKTELSFISVMQELHMDVTPANSVPNIVKMERADYNPTIGVEEHEYSENITLVPGQVSYQFTVGGVYRVTAQIKSKGGEVNQYFYIIVEIGEASRIYKSKVAENGEVTIQAGRFGKRSSKGPFFTDYGYYGLGSFEVGDTLELFYTGKNLPNLALFTDTNAGQPVGDGTGMWVQTSNNSKPWSSRLSITSPNRAETGNIGDYDNYDYNDFGAKNDKWAEELSLKDYLGAGVPASPFGYLLMEDGVEYRLAIITSEPVKGNVKLVFELYKKVGNAYSELVATATFNQAHRLPALTGTYAIAYSVGSYVNQEVTFKYNIISNRHSEIYRNSDTFEITFNGAKDGKFAYYGIENYKAKDTVEATFEGKNIPNLAIFSEKLGGQPFTENTKGLYIEVGNTEAKLYNLSDSTAPVKTIADFNKGLLADGEKYAYSVTTDKTGLEVDVTLKLLKYNAQTSKYDIVVKTVSTGLTDFGSLKFVNGYAVAYGGEAEIKTTLGIVSYVNPDAIVLAKGTEDHHVETAATEWAAYAVENVRQDQAVQVKFEGKNIPNVVLLADSATGNAYGGGKGYAFISTQTNALSRFYVSGPNRACIDGSFMFGRGAENLVTDANAAPYVAPASYDNLDENNAYILTLQSKKKGDNVAVYYELKTELGAEVYSKLLLVNDDYAKTLYANGNEAYPVILYGNAISDISFTCEVVTADWSMLPTAIKGTEDYHQATAFTKWDYEAINAVSQTQAVKLSFTGKNIPNVAVLTDKPSGQAYGGGKGYIFISTQNYPGMEKRLYASGPNRACIDANNIFGRGEENLITDSSSPAAPASYGGLDDNTNYVLTVQSRKNGDGVIIYYELKKADGTMVYNKMLTLTDDYAKTLYSTTSTTHPVILYGNAKQDINFSYEVVAADWSTLTFSLAKGSEVRTGTYSTSWNYLSTEPIAENEVLEIKFTGKNIPNVAVLTDNGQGQAYGGGKGYIFVTTQITAAAQSRIYASGPNRACIDGNSMFGRGTENILTETSNTAATYSGLDASTDYVLTISTYKVTTGVAIAYTVKKADGTSVYSKTLTVTDDYATSLYANETDKYQAIIYGNAVQAISFKYSVKPAAV